MSNEYNSLPLLFKLKSFVDIQPSDISQVLAELTPEQESILFRISPFIESQLPDFVRSDYPIFVSFLEAYYEWVEQNDNSVGAISRLTSVSDVDTTIDSFVSQFRNTYLLNFPTELAIADDGVTPLNIQSVIKNIKEFYKLKGTEKAFEFLFRIIYNSVLEFYYPEEDMLRLSDGRWNNPDVIKTSAFCGNDIFNFVNKKLRQKDPYNKTITAYATVDSAIQYSVRGASIAEFSLKEINGTFVPGRPAFCDVGGTTGEVYENTYGILSEVRITSPGFNYRIGDPIVLNRYRTGSDDVLVYPQIDFGCAPCCSFGIYEQDPSIPIGEIWGTPGAGAAGYVSQVGLQGEILEIHITDGGIFYSEPVPFTVRSKTGDGSAYGSLIPKAVNRKPGYYDGNKGKVSSNKVMQDNDYYQVHSYVLRSEVTLSKFKETIKKLIHPAGMKVFGEIALTRVLQRNESQDLNISKIQEYPIIGHYTPYTPGTTLNLRNNGLVHKSDRGASGDVYPLGYNPFAATGPDGSVFNSGVHGITFVTMPEGGITRHDPLERPLGSSGATHGYGTAIDGGYTAAKYLGITYFSIYFHPNVRGITTIPAGISFDGITLHNFMLLDVNNVGPTGGDIY
jgi:hypothetical protein